MDYLINPEFMIDQSDYHITTDTLLLASSLVNIRHKDKVLEIGCNSGSLLKYVCLTFKPCVLDGVEIEEKAYTQAVSNLADYETVRIFHQDINTYQSDTLYDVIISNPPYFPLRYEKDEYTAKDIARSEVYLNLDQLLKCCARLLTDKGIIYFVYPSNRIAELIASAMEYRLKVATLQYYAHNADDVSNVMLVTLRKGKPSMIKMYPLLTKQQLMDKVNQLGQAVSDTTDSK